MVHPQPHHVPSILATLGHILPILGTLKDVNYWADITKHSTAWDRRTILMCEYIPPETKTLLEFGAGRCITKNYIPRGCRYIPSDIVDRGQQTIICDLNERPLVSFPNVDLMMFSGVLEYIHHVPALIDELAPKTKGFLVSYCCTDYYDKNIRQACGWYSISNRNFVKSFYRNGFEIVKLDKWENQRIYLFLKENC